MLSLGACPVDDIDTTFYSEIQPISSHFVPDRMRYGSMGLECLVRYKEIDPTCNPLHSDFIPARVLEILKEHGERPKDTMERYALWIRSVSE
jgi:hypothetical protein